MESTVTKYDYSLFQQMSDEELVEIAKCGNNNALEFIIERYRNFVKTKARAYFLVGADRDDIVQEGMIGLCKAIRDYRADKLSSFKVFAELCVTRQIITAIKTATRQKHSPLNTYISLNRPVYFEDGERTLLDVISSLMVSDPEEEIIAQEECKKIKSKINELLSDLEKKVLIFYAEGRSYQEIALELNRHVKSIDNALQRIKRKLEKSLKETD